MWRINFLQYKNSITIEFIKTVCNIIIEELKKNVMVLNELQHVTPQDTAETAWNFLSVTHVPIAENDRSSFPSSELEYFEE